MLKIASAGAAVAGFGVLSILVRSGAHTGSTATTSTPASSSAGGALAISSRISQEAADGSFLDSGSGSVSPNQSSSPPQASTHTS